jgi:hypothetical protein
MHHGPEEIYVLLWAASLVGDKLLFFFSASTFTDAPIVEYT